MNAGSRLHLPLGKVRDQLIQPAAWNRDVGERTPRPGRYWQGQHGPIGKNGTGHASILRVEPLAAQNDFHGSLTQVSDRDVHLHPRGLTAPRLAHVGNYCAKATFHCYFASRACLAVQVHQPHLSPDVASTAPFKDIRLGMGCSTAPFKPTIRSIGCGMLGVMQSLCAVRHDAFE